eukprot:Pompholyxophrys_punicea_v1_NODE_1288_length_813_cov_1.977573.p1 type:complete len:101 gc:universal NODE_1288_length_813_cov_1.977573:557-255(-)
MKPQQMMATGVEDISPIQNWLPLVLGLTKNSFDLETYEKYAQLYFKHIFQTANVTMEIADSMFDVLEVSFFVYCFDVVHVWFQLQRDNRALRALLTWNTG